MKPCPFCFSDGRVQRMRGVAGESMFAIACTNDQCLAVGPLASTETEAVKKWDSRNLNISRKPRNAPS
jgi:hypothetical protein